MRRVYSSRISLVLLYLIVGRFESRAYAEISATDKRSAHTPSTRKQRINENQSRPCLLEKDSRVYTCIRTLSTCAHVSMRMISHDRYRRCFARVPPRTHIRTYALARAQYLYARVLLMRDIISHDELIEQQLCACN